MKEVWRPIPGYEWYYEVSNLARRGDLQKRGDERCPIESVFSAVPTEVQIH